MARMYLNAKNGRAYQWTAAIAALVCVGMARAHHSQAMFDSSTPIWVKGTVVRYKPAHPHAMIALEERKENGEVQRWNVEGPNLLRLGRMGAGEDFLKAGDVIEVCGFAFRKGGITQDWSRDANGSLLPFIHGHVLVMPDGHMRLFGPYGKLANCIRPHDTTKLWVDFLNTDPLARQAWCNSRNFVTIPTRPPKGFMEDINRLMADPCN